MTSRKVILFSLILPVSISVWILMHQHNDNDIPVWQVCLLCGFGPWAVGLFAGALLTIIFKKPKAEPWFYLCTQLVLPLFFVVMLIVSKVGDEIHERNFGNVDDNHSLLEIGRPDVSPDIRPVQTAFLKLESSFSNPNSMLLLRYRSYWRDTVIDHYFDTTYSVYFTYLKDRKIHFSKIEVLGDSATVDSLEMPAAPERRYAGRHSGVWGGSLTGLEDVKRLLRDEPAWVRDTAIRILSQ